MPAFSDPMHVRCGDDIFPSLRAAGIKGTFVKWCDPLALGPAPAGVTQSEWYAVRSRFLAGSYSTTAEDALQDLWRQDEDLAAFHSHDAVVLWFEHDLFDQAILIYLLDWFSRQPRAGSRLWMVTTDRHPEVERFIGLGQLSPSQISGLYAQAAPVTAEQLDLARRAWFAWTADEPRTLAALAAAGTPELPYLAPALTRHLEDFPWTGDGLSLTERLALAPLAGGPMAASALFRSIQRQETAPWMGDSMVWAELERLRTGRVPLVSASEVSIGNATEIALTDAGRDVLEGRADNLHLNPPDRWHAGVRLEPRDYWRWDPAERSVHREAPAPA